MLTLPAWDCLPYDRASPGAAGHGRAAGDARRAAGARASRPQLLVTTANAASQRLLTPFRIRQLTRRLAEGERIERDALIGLLIANGYQRTDAVHDAGEFAVRGSIVDLFPGRRARGDPARFLRRRDRDDAPLRSRRPAHRPARPTAFTLMPASRSAARRGQHQALPRAAIASSSAPRATEDPLYQAVSEGRRLAGMEHWLPLVRGAAGDPVRPSRRRATSCCATPMPISALEARREAIDDYFANRERAMEARAGQLSPARRRTRSICRQGMDSGAIAERPIHLATPFREPESATASSTSRSSRPRDFAPERAQNANVYEAVVKHVAKLRQGQAQGRPRQLQRRRARAARRPARGSWPEVADAGRHLAGGARRRRPRRR